MGCDMWLFVLSSFVASPCNLDVMHLQREILLAITFVLIKLSISARFAREFRSDCQVFSDKVPHGKEQKYGIALWQDDASPKCFLCPKKFTIVVRRHHCRACGVLVCSECTEYVTKLRVPAHPLTCLTCIVLTIGSRRYPMLEKQRKSVCAKRVFRTWRQTRECMVSVRFLQSLPCLYLVMDTWIRSIQQVWPSPCRFKGGTTSWW
jgi:hypothetical protein